MAKKRILIATQLGLAGLIASGPAVADTQIIVRERLVVRVPAAPAIRWKEKKGPRCLAMREVAGAAVLAPNSVDLVLRGGQRMRARFAASCPALDYYGGFYVLPTPDGMLCADRDAVRARSGGECEVDRLRRLVPR